MPFAALDANADRSGINVAAYLADFDATDKAAGVQADFPPQSVRHPEPPYPIPNMTRQSVVFA